MGVEQWTTTGEETADEQRDPWILSPAQPGFWRSPLRGPWLTALLGFVLLAGVTVLIVTGLLSYAAYNPDLARVNDKTPDKGLLGFYLFSWPTDPHWLYRLTQGVHVTLGVVLVPVLLAKLWSVVPKLFALPPVRSVAHALERISLLLLVGGVLFEFVTGMLNVQLDYLFPGSFYRLHFYGAWVFIGAFAAHVTLRFPQAVRVLRTHGLRAPLRGPAAFRQEPPDESGLVTPRPAAPTLSRRGLIGLVGGGSVLLFVVTAGQSIGGPLRRTALLAPHGGRSPSAAPAAFRSTGVRPSRASERRTPATAGGWWCEDPTGVPCASPAPSCCICPSTVPNSRSPAWRAGRHRTRAGRVYGCGTWRPWSVRATRCRRS